MDIKKDFRGISAELLSQRSHACLLNLGDLIDLLASPDTGAPLCFDRDQRHLTDGSYHYELRDGLPILIPSRLSPFFSDRLQVPFKNYADSFLQYFLLATIKQSGEINAQPTEGAAQKHFLRMSEFLSDCTGTVLDVGCDNPALGASLFSDAAQYIGLDPFCTRQDPFRIIGVGEYLPFGDQSLDNVVFNTSLDHILDWRRALAEAKRVIRQGGCLYISSYIWVDRADLMSDSVHFHHFRLYEMMGALDELGFDNVTHEIFESPKGDAHRHGLYLKACKK